MLTRSYFHSTCINESCHLSPIFISLTTNTLKLIKFNDKASFKKLLSFIFHLMFSLNDSTCVLIGLRATAYFPIWITFISDFNSRNKFNLTRSFFLFQFPRIALVCRRPIIMLMRAFVKFVREREGGRNLQDECHVVSSKSCNPIRQAELTNTPQYKAASVCPHLLCWCDVWRR